MSSTKEATEKSAQNKNNKYESSGNGQEVLTQARESTDEVSEAAVQAEIELSGPLENILDHFGNPEVTETNTAQMEQIVGDMQELIEAVQQKNGAIRSELAADTDLQVSDDHIRYMLELLRVYGFVDLDSNTWVPGPKTER